MSYHHLTIEERACIGVYHKEKRSVTEIAEILRRNKATISRELRRNESRDEGYNAVGAQRKYNQRRRRCVRSLKLVEDTRLYELVREGLNRYWSPEQISHTLPRGFSVSYCTIYRAIDRRLLPKEKLRRYGKQLKRKKAKGICYDFSEVRTFDERPSAVDTRNRYGHWELDTIVLRPESKSHLATFVERKSRMLIMRKIPNKKAATMGDTIINTFRTIPAKYRKTFTVDRGLEFTDWKRIEKELNVKVYFCDPYSPQQRGTNENTNGLVRQFFPRRTILPEITDELVEQAQAFINNRPRKCLHWLSPFQKLLLFT